MDVFISYSRHDLDFVNAVAHSFIGTEIKLWWDSAKLSVGDTLSPMIFSMIDATPIFLVVMSDHSAVSSWVKKEVDYALSEATVPKAVIPVRLDGGAVLPSLADHIYTDALRSDQTASIRRIHGLVEKALTPTADSGRRVGTKPGMFIDHALETRRVGSVMTATFDMVSVDPEEHFSLLSQFEIVSQPGYESEFGDAEQVRRLIRECVTDLQASPALLTLASGDVDRDSLTINDGPNTFVLQWRIRRLGTPSTGSLVVPFLQLLEAIAEPPSK